MSTGQAPLVRLLYIHKCLSEPAVVVTVSPDSSGFVRLKFNRQTLEGKVGKEFVVHEQSAAILAIDARIKARKDRLEAELRILDRMSALRIFEGAITPEEYRRTRCYED